jgi:CBS domain containing-hemolysin-like protein
MTLLLTYLGIAIFVSFLCSVLEAVLLSITPSYVESLKQAGDVRGLKWEKLKKNIDSPLSAILAFNTIAHTIGAAGVGAQAAKVFGDDSLGVVSAVLTLLILIFSEIIPKTIGAQYWRALSGLSARILVVLIWIMYPLVILSKGISYLMGKKEGATVSRAEVSAMADIGEKEGVFLESESKMIKNLIRLKNVTIKDVMTPRTVMVSAEETEPIKVLLNESKYSKFSRIPVYLEKEDKITGYVHRYDVLAKLANDEHDMKLLDMRRNVLMMNENINLPTALDRLSESREQIAVVTNQYGGVVGIVTMEDIMETVMGVEIIDEFDSVEDMQKYARSQWKERARKLGLEVDETKTI